MGLDPNYWTCVTLALNEKKGVIILNMFYKIGIYGKLRTRSVCTCFLSRLHICTNFNSGCIFVHNFIQSAYLCKILLRLHICANYLSCCIFVQILMYTFLGEFFILAVQLCKFVCLLNIETQPFSPKFNN